MKIFKKCNFGVRNDRIWPKNDDSPEESFPFTYFQPKICTNLPQTEFWRKKKTTTETKILKKILFRRPKPWNLAKKQRRAYGVLLVDTFPIKKLHRFLSIWIPAQNKTRTETKIFEKMPFRRPKRWNLAKKGWTSSGVLSVDPVPIEKLHQF